MMDIAPWRAFWLRPPDGGGVWIPAMDVYETDKEFVVKAELPGIKEDDIDVAVVGDMLTIKGEKAAESEIDEDNFYSMERTYGSFSRSVMFPASVNAEKLEAKYEDGVLEIGLPKFAEVSPKKVKVTPKKKVAK